MSLLEIAEDKYKIALIDLLRLLMQYEASAAHVLYQHWDKIEVTVFGYIECFDLKDAEAKTIQNYHLGCLKMLGNIFLTDVGKEYMMQEEKTRELIKFVEASIKSVNLKVVFHSAMVLFSSFLCFKKDKKLIETDSKAVIVKISNLLVD